MNDEPPGPPPLIIPHSSFIIQHSSLIISPLGSTMAKATYKAAGVDLDLYEDAMSRLPRLLARTYTPRVIHLEQGFAGLFRLDFANQLFARKYKEPVLVSCTDGVGTKLKVAAMMGVHHTVGIDLVAMSVNDAICCGAEPLFFLDYVAMPKDDPPLLEQLVRGISDGCLQADCALLGGETAILPDLYAPGDYDLAGFCVGVVERGHVIDGKAMTPGDVVLGLASTGLHSNGYSLARKVVIRHRRPEGGRPRGGAGSHGGRGPVGAHADLRPPDPLGAHLLQGQGRGPWDCPHHRRRAAGEPGADRTRGDPRSDRPRQLAGRRRCSAGFSAWARSSRRRWIGCSTWAWGWCWW